MNKNYFSILCEVPVYMYQVNFPNVVKHSNRPSKCYIISYCYPYFRLSYHTTQSRWRPFMFPYPKPKQRVKILYHNYIALILQLFSGLITLDIKTTLSIYGKNYVHNYLWSYIIYIYIYLDTKQKCHITGVLLSEGHYNEY